MGASESKDLLKDAHRRIIFFRLIVGYLGESHQAGWWQTMFLSATGTQYLRIVFPRSFLSAAINCVTEAARRLHDERIGKRGVYHLFRMPNTVEEPIHDLLLRSDSNDWLPAIANREAAVERLRAVASGSTATPSTATPAEGPIQIGRQTELLSHSAVKRMAGQYLSAFERGHQVFPYFVAG